MVLERFISSTTQLLASEFSAFNMAAATEQTPSTLYLAQARAAPNAKDCMAIYDKWAATYNAEVGDKAQDYVAPVLVSQIALKSAPTTDPATAVILDAGCGTGLVGQALASLGAKHIDGIDLSVPMLDIAEKTGVYRNVSQADMNQELAQPDNEYDIITCVGTFTLGHVGPDPALRELVRVAKKDGVVVSTILEELWLQGGFKAEAQKLQAEGLVTILADDLVDYVKGHGDKAAVLVLQKN